jgi:hypothetical protein
MMTADQVIESYVRDVAHYLPRAKRDDLAFELRELLRDEMAAKATAAGRAADRDMALELLARFGRPAEAASRYHPRAPLIDPADNHNFLIWVAAGAVVLSAGRPSDGIVPLQWVGVVFVWFAIAAWVRRRRPAGQLHWRPRPQRLPEVASQPATLLAGVATLVFPFAMYLAPQEWWEAASLGRSVGSGLVLTEEFRHSWQRALTLVALGMLAAPYFVATAMRGWRTWSRHNLVFAHLFVGVMFALHAAPMRTLFGRETFGIFELRVANQVAMPIFGLVGGVMMLAALYGGYKEWARVTPAPALRGAVPG